MPQGDRLTATAHATMVLLAFGDASGYELKQRADNTLRFFFNAPAMSQIYTELDRLIDRGLVEARDEVRAGERATRVVRLSRAGWHEVERWLRDDALPTTVFKSHLALRFVVGHAGDPERLRADIATERQRVARDVTAIAAVHAMLDPHDPQLGWAWLVANWGVRYYADMLAQLDELDANLTHLLAGEAPPAAPADTPLDGPRLRVVPMDAAHHDALRAIRAVPEIARIWLGNDPDWPLDDDADNHPYTIIDVGEGPPEGTIVGFIQWYEHTDPDYHHAGIDLFLHPSAWGRGLGTEAVTLVATHLVDDRGFHRVVIDPAADNARAIATYRKVGFRDVGIMRRYERGADGEWHDGLLMDLLPDDLVRLKGRPR